MKCHFCGEEIKDIQTLYKSPKYDRKKKIKRSAKGDILFWDYHKECFIFKDREDKGKELLFDYLKDKFFAISVPLTMFQYIMNLRNSGNKYNREKKKLQGYPFQIMYEALLKEEDNLINVYNRMSEENQFKDDDHKVNLIIKFMNKNLDFLYEKYLLEEKQKQIKEVKKQIVNTTVETKSEVRMESKSFIAPQSKNKLVLSNRIK